MYRKYLISFPVLSDFFKNCQEFHNFGYYFESIAPKVHNVFIEDVTFERLTIQNYFPQKKVSL